MSGFVALFRANLKMSLRNPLALIYGLAFPLLFLVGFWAIYRGEPVPLLLHAGQFFCIAILGTAAFGLPTQMVAERETGLWRRYAVAPVPRAVFMAAILAGRLLILALALALQLALALALGMPLPAEPALLAAAALAAAFAFLGLGAIIGMVAPNVPAVQALGQCIFLPMLIIGGVAVPLSSLPGWALSLSHFLPGRPAVSALQAGVGGGEAMLPVLLLLGQGLIGFAAAVLLFRWAPAQQQRLRARPLLLVVLAAGWVAMGLSAGREAPQPAIVDLAPAGSPADYVRLAPPAPPVADTPPAQAVQPEPKPEPKSPAPPRGWRALGPADYARIDWARLPPDQGLVSPVAAAAELPDEALITSLDAIRSRLVRWPPGAVADPVQRVRNLLLVAAVPDLLQQAPLERHLPLLVLAELRRQFSPDDLARLLAFVSLHPDEGSVEAVAALPELGLSDITGPRTPVRGRVMLYAFKLLGRLTGARPGDEKPPESS